MLPNKKPEWLVPAGLLLLSAIPVAAGSARVAELAGGARVTADNARFFAMPLPVVLHIFGASIFCVLGAFQFVPALRRRRPRWHRVAGRLLVPCGLVAALSGLWMTLGYELPPGDGDLLMVFRLLFGTAMAGSIVLATVAIRRRDVRRHRVWMTRGYAIGLGAGTQVLTHVPWALLVGVPGEVTRAMLMAAGWVINLVVAEWALRRRPRAAVINPQMRSLLP
ncbi:DUF2306 domain-containing protein [Amycolatopsis vancoresmycina]|uniref:DUF2306 domain-containing protein n=1 Tax=Amycolatopsis vancoresmycina DSM 44592 TaxID=1292037 RepID=R1G076_9PSEU|nr:DUF2306 domain-containing protein [Amycolatopsis vancoresmycina]EOD64922.1 hypothetical protein H480_29336 [Amycolatopsis vancoresmycina DSM 44592]